MLPRFEKDVVRSSGTVRPVAHRSPHRRPQSRRPGCWMRRGNGLPSHWHSSSKRLRRFFWIGSELNKHALRRQQPLMWFTCSTRTSARCPTERGCLSAVQKQEENSIPTTPPKVHPSPYLRYRRRSCTRSSSPGGAAPAVDPRAAPLLCLAGSLLRRSWPETVHSAYFLLAPPLQTPPRDGQGSLLQHVAPRRVVQRGMRRAAHRR